MNFLLSYHTDKAGGIHQCGGYVDNKNPSDNTGTTPLHEASSNGHFDICRLIIENTDKKNPSNSKGETPLDMAVKKGHHNEYLKAHYNKC